MKIIVSRISNKDKVQNQYIGMKDGKLAYVFVSIIQKH